MVNEIFLICQMISLAMTIFQNNHLTLTYISRSHQPFLSHQGINAELYDPWVSHYFVSLRINQIYNYIFVYIIIISKLQYVNYSTISSGLNSLSAVLLQDFVRLACFKDMSEARATRTTKIIGWYTFFC